MVVEDGVDLLEIDERLDVDRARLLRVGRVELVVGQHHDLAAVQLVAAGDLLPRHLLVLLGADAADLDARVVLLVQLVEVHAEVARGRHQLHGHVHEPEAEGAGPDWARHQAFAFAFEPERAFAFGFFVLREPDTLCSSSAIRSVSPLSSVVSGTTIWRPAAFASTTSRTRSR